MSGRFEAPIPLGIYVHIPWCVRKCPYCDFNSHAQKSALPEQRYVDALMADLEKKLPDIWGRRVGSVFIGGGTPSLFSADSMQRLLDGLRQRLPIMPSTEITMEANPGTFEIERFEGFRAAGINRLSIGIQSFSDHHLKTLGRIHTANNAKNAFEAAQQAGFDNINLDLMFALPGQTLDQCLDDLRTAIKLRPQHISFYQLTLEPNTEFHVHPPVLPDDELAWSMQQQGAVMLAEAGYLQYEVSAYAATGRQCRHNLNYWEFGDYLGLGAGAHGKVTSAADATVKRHHNHRDPGRYMDKALAGSPESGESVLSEADLSFEFMLNALRLKSGVESRLFEERTGLPLAAIQERLATARNDGLLDTDVGRIAPTSLGFQYLNELILRFLEDSEDVD